MLAGTITATYSSDFRVDSGSPVEGPDVDGPAVPSRSVDDGPSQRDIVREEPGVNPLADI